MPEVVRITHKDIVRRCRIPDDWAIPMLDVNQRLLIINVRAIRDAFVHAASEMHHEIGGYITGYPAYDDVRGIAFLYIDKVVRGMYESSPTHVTLFAQGYVAADAVCRADHTYVVGWYHSHPRLTVFFSGTDHNNHRSNFARPHEVGMVVDPAQGEVPADGDSVTIQAALNQRNFAMFMWNRAADAVIRATTSIVYVDTAPHQIPRDAATSGVAGGEVPVDSTTDDSQGAHVADTQPPAPTLDEVFASDDTVPTTNVPMIWEESIYAQMLHYPTVGLANGTCVVLYGVSQRTTMVYSGWQTDLPHVVVPRDHSVVGVVLMADDVLAATLLQSESQQQLCDCIHTIIGTTVPSLVFPFHVYLITANQYLHTVAYIQDAAACVWHAGEPLVQSSGADHE